MRTPEFEVSNDDTDSFHRDKVKVTVWTDWEDAQKLVQLAFELADKPDPVLEALKKEMGRGIIAIPNTPVATSIFDDELTPLGYE